MRGDIFMPEQPENQTVQQTPENTNNSEPTFEQKVDAFSAYIRHADLFRTWVVAFCIGLAATLFGAAIKDDPALFNRMGLTFSLLLAGGSCQLISTLISKYCMYARYFEHEHPTKEPGTKLPNPQRFFWNITENSYIDLLLDVFSLLFIVASLVALFFALFLHDEDSVSGILKLHLQCPFFSISIN